MSDRVKFLNVKVIFIAEFSEVKVNFLWCWHQVSEEGFKFSVDLVLLFDAYLDTGAIEGIHHVV